MKGILNSKYFNISFDNYNSELAVSSSSSFQVERVAYQILVNSMKIQICPNVHVFFNITNHDTKDRRTIKYLVLPVLN